MITPNETTLTYKESTIRLIKQGQTVVIKWESKVDSSVGHLQVSQTNWTDGEIVRLVMENIDRCYNKYQKMRNKC
jgi:hypothetical protein